MSGEKRLKGGRLAAEKLKAQLLKIAMRRTGGEKTDEILGKKGGPEGLPDSIIVTADGVEGDVPVDVPEAIPAAVPSAGPPVLAPKEDSEPEPVRHAAKPAKKSRPAPKKRKK